MKRHGGNLKCVLLSERSHSEKAAYILYESNYRTFWKRQNEGGSKKNLWFPVFGDPEG